jgi:hypothetical protein
MGIFSWLFGSTAEEPPLHQAERQGVAASRSSAVRLQDRDDPIPDLSPKDGARSLE